MFITDSQIQKILTNNQDFISLKKDFDANRVSEIYMTYNNNTNTYKILAYVEIEQEDITVIIELNKQHDVNSYESCSVMPVAIILLMLQNISPTSFPFHYVRGQEIIREEVPIKEKTESDTLLALYRAQLKTALKDSLTSEKASIYTTIEVTSDLLYVSFSLKYLEHMYAIHSISQFIAHVQKEQTYSYDETISFNHRLDNFEEDSRRVYFFLLALSTSASSLKVWKKADQRMEVTRELMDLFYDTYKKVNVKYINIAIMDTNWKPKIKIEKRNDHYVFSLLDSEMVYFGHRHMYKYDNHIIHRCFLDSNRKASHVLTSLMQKDIIVREDVIYDFYAIVLSDILKYIELVGESINPPYEKTIQLYGDIDLQERLCISITYVYPDGSSKLGFNNANSSISVQARKIEGFIEGYSNIDYIKHIAYMDINKTETLAFVQQGLSYLQPYCQIYIGQALHQIKDPSKRLYFHIDVALDNDLLSFDISSADIPKEELEAVLKAYRQKKKFYRLSNGDTLYLQSSSLEEVNHLLERFNVSTASFHSPLYQVFTMDVLAKDSKNIAYQKASSLKKLQANFSKKKQYTLSDFYNKTLREYQKYGYNWLQTIRQYGLSGILADDMGLGKTIQIITLLSENKKSNRVSLVVCPASLLFNWEDEIVKFSNQLTYLVIHGDADNRGKKIQQIHHYDLIVTSYDYLRRDIDVYKDIPFYYVILDEAQFIKNYKTKNANTVKSLHAKHKAALTGTPIENSLAEIWSIFDFLMPGYLSSYSYFKKKYEIPIIKDKDEKKQEELKRLITPFILRRTKKDVLPELPDKIESTIHIQLAEEEKKLYVANIAKFRSQIKDNLGILEKIDVLAMLTRLRQICCELRLVYENIQMPSSKIVTCMEIIQNLHRSKKKVLIFSSFTGVLNLLGKELDKEKIPYYVLTGKTKKVQRHQLVQSFQEDDTTAFLISLKAGGTGLNLTAAEAVIHFDPWWNYSVESQATDRAYRMGQKRKVQVFKLIMKDTVEEKVQQLQERKRDLANTFIEGNGGTITNMQLQDLIDLF